MHTCWTPLPELLVRKVTAVFNWDKFLWPVRRVAHHEVLFPHNAWNPFPYILPLSYSAKKDALLNINIMYCHELYLRKYPIFWFSFCAQLYSWRSGTSTLPRDWPPFDCLQANNMHLTSWVSALLKLRAKRIYCWLFGLWFACGCFSFCLSSDVCATKAAGNTCCEITEQNAFLSLPRIG